MSSNAKSDVLIRLRRIEGQIRGLQGMIDRGEDCQSVLTQLNAARRALDKVGFIILTHKMRECLEKRTEPEAQDASLEEAMEMFLSLA